MGTRRGDFEEVFVPHGIDWDDPGLATVMKNAKFYLHIMPFIYGHRMDNFFDECISHCIINQQEIKQIGSYKPCTGGIGKSLFKYSPELFFKLQSVDSKLRNKIIGYYLEYTELLKKPRVSGIH